MDEPIEQEIDRGPKVEEDIEPDNKDPTTMKSGDHERNLNLRKVLKY